MSLEAQNRSLLLVARTVGVALEPSAAKEPGTLAEQVLDVLDKLSGIHKFYGVTKGVNIDPFSLKNEKPILAWIRKPTVTTNGEIWHVCITPQGLGGLKVRTDDQDLFGLDSAYLTMSLYRLENQISTGIPQFVPEDNARQWGQKGPFLQFNNGNPMGGEQKKLVIQKLPQEIIDDFPAKFKEAMAKPLTTSS